MPKPLKLNLVYIAEIILFFLIIFGALPRWWSFVLAGILIVYTLFASLEDATVLFVRSIPLFIALPITSNFDNFNTWRIIAVIIFLRWLYYNRKNNPFPLIYKGDSRGLLALLFISILSVFVASDKTAAILRIIYFVNLSMVPIVIYYIADKKRIIKNFIPPLIIVLVVGFFQLVSTYFMDIYGFIDFWGWGAQCRQFGMEWCRIAVEQGNTWFAYNSLGQINLRMFSLFTDSHTFPMYILMALPAVFVWLEKKSSSHWPSIIIPFSFLAAILSNTRGIWLAGWAVAFVVFIVLLITKVKPWGTYRGLTLVGPARWLLIYLLLFTFVYPISATPQFNLYAGKATLTARVRSILDFAETSNALRIAIWKSSLRSIAEHPLLGVGIGNFPVVLNQDIELAKAGSSAHNIYLQVGAELGIPALIIFLWLLWIILKTIHHKRSTIYGSALFIFYPWIFLYLMTDSALFDERAFLMFSTVIATILSGSTAESGIERWNRSKL